MIKCEYETFECKGRKFDVQAEFEVIFMNYFEILLKYKSLEDALRLYTQILTRFDLAIEKYKKQNEKTFHEVYMDVVIKENAEIKNLIDDLTNYFEKKKRERND
ncbi:MAG: hypothetical protein J6W35_06815 [Eubacterium sp.]|nr:hypothetical protein [Eubacterium sp.]